MSEHRSINLLVTHPDGDAGLIRGFRYLWAYYVKAYDPSQHCQPCFIGSPVNEFCTPRATTGAHTFDRLGAFPYLYICGVASGRKDELAGKNLHLPLRHSPGSVVEATTYNGYQFRLTDAELLPIPPLPAGWKGLPLEHTQCKNFRFAVSVFGE